MVAARLPADLELWLEVDVQTVDFRRVHEMQRVRRRQHRRLGVFQAGSQKMLTLMEGSTYWM
jgi:hypothetical protein